MQAVKLAKKIGAVKAANELQLPVNMLCGWIQTVNLPELDIVCDELIQEDALSIANENQQLQMRIKAFEIENKRLIEMN